MGPPADAEPAAARHHRLPFGAWLVAAGLLQLALFAYAAAPGLAVTSDSRLYLYAAQTLRDSGHLLHPDGTPYRYWPPLYPVLLRVSGSLAAIRVLHAGVQLGSLLLWSWLGRQLLPGRRGMLLPVLLALSTPWLLVGKFVWSECVFILLFGAYAAALFQWLRSGQGRWWWMLTAVGLLMPLERTLGLFLLAGVGAGLLLGQWRQLSRLRWLLLALHLALSTVGGVLWQWYALHAGPSRYHPSRGWGQLLSSGADYGFVLSRWLLPLPTASRVFLPEMLWALGLLALFGLLWPRWSEPEATILNKAAAPDNAAGTTQSFGRPAAIPAAFQPAQLLLGALWSASLTLVALVAALTLFAQSAAGIHDAERYASVLFGPVMLLSLAAWPARAPRWLGMVVSAGWLLTAALRVGHVAIELRKLTPLAPASFPGPGPDGQRVGAAGK
ncbi:hypothetical protein [Hymenobacter rubidus]|uniref:hypothetical protein n=1 Tax=Hymenobacter rubidus TaxID=1441626 RepID=UPI00191E420C|nr:hypothetical protein [Hymenobacter rubidus]